MINIKNEMRKILERRALHALKGKGPMVTEKLYGSAQVFDLAGNEIVVDEVLYRYENGETEELAFDGNEIQLYINGNREGGWNVTPNGEICWG